MGRLQYDDGDIGGAVSYLTGAIKRNPRDPRFYFYRGTARFDLGGYGGALADFTKALNMNPDMDAAYVNRAVTRLQIWNRQEDPWEDPISALQTVKKIQDDLMSAVNTNWDNFCAHYNIGVLSHMMGNCEAAETALTNAIAISPTDEIAYCMRADARCCLKKFTEAVADLKAALMIDPEYEAAERLLELAKAAQKEAA